MRTTHALLTVAAALAAAGPASAAGGVPYAGKTDSGHKITFTVKNGRLHELRAGVRTSCLPIQGGGSPTGGVEVFGFRGSLKVKPHLRYSFMEKPAFHYNEVTMNNDLWLKRHSRYTFMEKPAFHYREVTMNNDLWLQRAGRGFSGRMRLQYEFLIPKYPIGTFSIYSCLGGAKFTARPA
jgi:hypothetical protein